MLTAKQLLLKQTAEAFSGRPDMPLMASLVAMTQEEASWQPDEATPSIEQLVRHLAWAKSRYCYEAFGRPMVLDDPSVNARWRFPICRAEFPCGAAWGSHSAPGIDQAIKLLEQSHRVLTECLESCPEDAMEKPLPTRHGRSAAHFFWILLMHDLCHAGQIRTRRTLYRISRAVNEL